MIYIVTMNPSLDYIIQMPRLNIGKVNRTQKEYIYFGGKGINVSIVLKELGFNSICLGFIAGFTGQELQSHLQKKSKIQTDFINVSQGMTRINVKINDGEETEINGSGPIIQEKDIETLLEQLDRLKEEDILILSGSIPQSVSQFIYSDILKRLSSKRIKVIVDTTNIALMKTIEYQPFLIKPNKQELEELFSVQLDTLEDIEYYARKLQKMGAKNVLISMAKEGSLLLDEYGNKYRIGVCQGKLENSIGAGDSMIAGFIAGYLLDMSYLDSLKLATASGGATAFSSGLATREKIYQLYNQLI